MGYMKIVWEWSIESESARILEMSTKVSNGFYQLHHFLPLPFDLKKVRTDSSHHVYLPDIPYTKIPRYWESVSKAGHHYPLPKIASISDHLVDYLSTIHLPSLDHLSLKIDAETYLPKAISWLSTTFPTLPLPEIILIHPSYFGTTGSFHFNQALKTVILYLRNDQDLYTLVEILLSAILRPHAGETLYTDWEKTEYLVDYLLLESSLKNILPPAATWQPTTIPPHYPESLKKESSDFLQKIGLNNHSECQFKLQGEVIFFNKVPLTDFTPHQNALLKALINRSPTPLTLDEIGNIIFTKDEKFSLAAISKTIERLRKKFADLGISSSYIATSSGIGYYLKN